MCLANFTQHSVGHVSLLGYTGVHSFKGHSWGMPKVFSYSHSISVISVLAVAILSSATFDGHK